MLDGFAKQQEAALRRAWGLRWHGLRWVEVQRQSFASPQSGVGKQMFEQLEARVIMEREQAALEEHVPPAQAGLRMARL